MREHNRVKSEYFIIVFFVLLIIVFYLFPLVRTFVLSFAKVSTFGEDQFVGFDNYITILKEESFRTSIINTLTITFLSSIISVTLSLWFSYLIKFVIKSVFLKILSVLFLVLPSLLATIAIGIIWSFLLNYQFGIVNQILGYIGFERIYFLTERIPAIFSLTVVNIWRDIGYTMIIFFAFYRNVPMNSIKASQIDGCSHLQTFKLILLPLISNFVLIIFSLNVISSLKMYDLVYLMIGERAANLAGVNTLLSLFYRYAYTLRDRGLASSLIIMNTFLILLILFAIYFSYRIRMKNEKINFN